MKIDVIDYSRKLSESLFTGKTAIVIDVFRCTTSMITALKNGAAEIVPTREPEDAVAAANRIGRKDCVLGGERGGLRMPGFDFGNSPFEYSSENVRNKNVVISTTNGSNAICKAEGAEYLFLGAMTNSSAAARRAAETGKDVLILCSGNHETTAAEDWYAAGAITHALRQLEKETELTDTALIAEQLYLDIQNNTFDLSKTLHYRELYDLGFADDIEYCLRQDICDCVPVYKNGILQC